MKFSTMDALFSVGSNDMSIVTNVLILTSRNESRKVSFWCFIWRMFVVMKDANDEN
jgi:hypothetical protein